MAKRREFTRNQREEIVERSKRDGIICCEGCGQVLGAKPYEIDHIIPEALRPEADKQKRLTIADGQLLGKACCHRGEDGKTNKDIKAIAEAKRRYDRANGLKRQKKPITSAPFRGHPRQSAAIRTRACRLYLAEAFMRRADDVDTRRKQNRHEIFYNHYGDFNA